MKITIHARSSSGDSYPVEFSDELGFMKINCHCKAGLLEQMCKHKLALIKGDEKILYNISDKQTLDRLLSLPSYQVLQKSVEEYENQIENAENEIIKLKKFIIKLKSNLAYEIAHGKIKSR